MFVKVLVANRGAIATRITRTLKQMGVGSVAVYADCDSDSLHVSAADEAYCLGPGVAAETYLDIDKILAIAAKCGADAIHPGYGFLSENPGFVRRCEAAGIAFIGPTAEQIESFGLKHAARQLALAAGVPLSPGSNLLADLPHARREAASIGYPVMLKSTAGGGGIGMQLCHDEDELSAAFESVRRVGNQNFADDNVYLEKFISRARHIEVQVFGDGSGGALALGERDCSSQRRNQKVVEECPAPNLSEEERAQLHRTAETLLSSINYRNAGTVEFIFDSDARAFYFLEVNTRLQVEHGVTEEVFDVDLVNWMIRQAAGELPTVDQLRKTLRPSGHAVQVRIYAEDPYQEFRPCAGLLSSVSFPSQEEGVRVDHWVESGTEVPAYFDPMLAKVIVHEKDRASAFSKLQCTLKKTVLYGCQTNLDYLRALCRDPTLLRGEVTTRYLDQFKYEPRRIDVLQAGTMTTLQDFPGRRGYWHVGVPPSGPFDSYSFRLGNRLLGNPPDAAGLEATLQGPVLRFSSATAIVLTGAPHNATLDGDPLPMWRVVDVAAGQSLNLGRLGDTGARAYLCIAGGIQCPKYLGSRSTFTLGQFGGHGGRALRAGDVLSLQEPHTTASHASSTTAINAGFAAPVEASGATQPKASSVSWIPPELRPQISNHWQLRVIYGPHGAPDFFTQEDIDTFFAHEWEVHYNSSRTGIRLIGPKPSWARSDGGEAGLHPSNIHDNAYAFGTVDFTGDMPVILGPDGPSLGGFVCPATVITADLWKLGQLRAGDRVRFMSVSMDSAVALETAQLAALETLQPKSVDCPPSAAESCVVKTLSAEDFGDDIVLRAAGDHFLLIEYGKPELDIRLRFRAHALMQWLQDNPLPGLYELTPGIRSLQVHFDSQQLPLDALISHLHAGEQALSERLAELTVPSRIVYLPLSWDDEACQRAVDKYMQSVRADAPWCPSNLEFIRRINGLRSVEAVREILFGASYLVMGLGDVYLGAPVATPIDPRHRLVTTKYNPARTWTAENSVGIGGSYLCVYGMEGPGGYQFVGRTLQMWNRYRKTAEFTTPWLLRFFDQVRFYPVDHEELRQIRRDFPLGRHRIRIEESSFSLTEYEDFLEAQRPSIRAFRDLRERAFATELEHWQATGQFEYEAPESEVQVLEQDWPDESTVVSSPVTGSVWTVVVSVGQQVKTGDTLMVLESMKMEIPLQASGDGVVSHLLLAESDKVMAGQALVVLE
jgi:urea carboxylase